MSELVEPVPAPEIFTSGLAKIEDIGGGCLRFYLYVMQAPIDGEGPADRVVVAKIVAPASAVPDAVMKMLASIGRAVGGAVVELMPSGLPH
jgi:hypothetical protein